jgi:hypothetical protein
MEMEQPNNNLTQFQTLLAVAAIAQASAATQTNENLLKQHSLSSEGAAWNLTLS